MILLRSVALQKTLPRVDKIIYSSIAQSVERVTVNHDVTGSSPVRGAKKKASRKTCFFQWSAPKRMKNEAGLPPMKRAFGTRREKRALRFTRAKLHSNSWVLNGNKVAASYLRSNASFQTQVLFSYVRKQPITYNALHWFKASCDVTTSAMRTII